MTRSSLTSRGKAPCLGCERREVGCRSGCEAYIQWARRESARKEVERRNRKAWADSYPTHRARR